MDLSRFQWPSASRGILGSASEGAIPDGEPGVEAVEKCAVSERLLDRARGS